MSAEEHRPYDRPPLSKELLTGERAEASLTYRSGDWYATHSIDLLQGFEAIGLRPHERRLRLSDGGTLRYHRLLIATGSRPRVLPLLDSYENVSALRTLDDGTALRDVLSGRPRLVVIGAGFIGQEVSAAALKVGCRVTMIEAAPCPLASLLGSDVGGWFTRLHEAEGVEVMCGCTVERVGGDRRVRTLQLSSGETLDADHVLVGVGVDPETRWLVGSGLDAARGVAVDQHGRSPIHDVFAAGDAAATFDPGLGRYVPGSHWEAAARQGSRAARTMLRLDPGAAPLTSFWTDQYGIRIQYLGRSCPRTRLSSTAIWARAASPPSSSAPDTP